MPSAIDTAAEHARGIPEEHPYPADEPARHLTDVGRPRERVPALDVLDRSFWDGASDAFANGWPTRR